MQYAVRGAVRAPQPPAVVSCCNSDPSPPLGSKRKHPGVGFPSPQRDSSQRRCRSSAVALISTRVREGADARREDREGNCSWEEVSLRRGGACNLSAAPCCPICSRRSPVAADGPPPPPPPRGTACRLFAAFRLNRVTLASAGVVLQHREPALRGAEPALLLPRYQPHSTSPGRAQRRRVAPGPLRYSPNSRVVKRAKEPLRRSCSAPPHAPPAVPAWLCHSRTVMWAGRARAARFPGPAVPAGKSGRQGSGSL